MVFKGRGMDNYEIHHGKQFLYRKFTLITGIGNLFLQIYLTAASQFLAIDILINWNQSTKWVDSFFLIYYVVVFDNLSIGKGWILFCSPSSPPLPFCNTHWNPPWSCWGHNSKIFSPIFRILESQRLCDNNLCTLRHTLLPLAPPPNLRFILY